LTRHTMDIAEHRAQRFGFPGTTYRLLARAQGSPRRPILRTPSRWHAWATVLPCLRPPVYPIVSTGAQA
jgi:hypothetical protein